MSDLIDRQALKQALGINADDCDKCAWGSYGRCKRGSDFEDACCAIDDAPSAEPRCIATIQLSQEQLDEAFEKVKADILSVKPKTGKWIGGELGECSVCGHEGCASDIWDRCKEHFCPNCGTRLEE